MSPQASAIQEVLENLCEGLAAAREALLAEPRPGAKVLETAVEAVKISRAKLAEAVSNAELSRIPEADRLDLVRKARQVQSQLKVVGKLVSGSAAFASLGKDGNGRGRATYGPDGGKRGAAPGEGLERQA